MNWQPARKSSEIANGNKIRIFAFDVIFRKPIEKVLSVVLPWVHDFSYCSSINNNGLAGIIELLAAFVCVINSLFMQSHPNFVPITDNAP